ADLLSDRLQRVDHGPHRPPEAITELPAQVRDRTIALTLRLQPQHMAELHPADAGNAAQRFTANIATEPLTQQHCLWQTEARPRVLGIGMEATRHCRNRFLRN